MFSRQWFPPQSQIGLLDDALCFENSLQKLEFASCFAICDKYSSFKDEYWIRQRKRAAHLLNRYAKGTTGVKVFFGDFWPDMDHNDCQMLDFLRLALKPISVSVTNDPSDCDISFYSCYGTLSSLPDTSHSTRLLFLGENIRPSYTHFDFSLTFDKSNYCGRNIFFPLWLLEIDWFQKTYTDRTTNPISLYTNSTTFTSKNRLPRIVYVGNNHEPLRMSIIGDLNRMGLTVDCFGSHSRPVDNKSRLLSSYLMCLAMENSIYPSYQTEKLLQAHPYIPHIFYWGANNPECFLKNRYTYHIDTTSPSLQIYKIASSILRDSLATITKSPLLSQEYTSGLFVNAVTRLKTSLCYLT